MSTKKEKVPAECNEAARWFLRNFTQVQRQTYTTRLPGGGEYFDLPGFRNSVALLTELVDKLDHYKLDVEADSVKDANAKLHDLVYCLRINLAGFRSRGTIYPEDLCSTLANGDHAAK